MKHIPLEAEPRPTDKSRGATKVRNEGYIPGILLGHHDPPVTFKVKAGDMTRALKQGGPNALLDLSIGDQKQFAMIREFTRDPVTRHIIHVDFQRVAANEPVEAHVPVLVTGAPASEYGDFIITQELASVSVKGLPDALPQAIEVDAATLSPNHPLHAGDLRLPDGVELAEEPTHVAVILAPPTLRREALEEMEAEAEGAAELASTGTQTSPASQTEE